MSKRHPIIIRVLQAVLIALSFFILGVGIYLGWQRRTRVDFHANLKEAAVEVDGEEITFRDLGFYVLYEEQKVESQALIYNKKNTKDYWNIHTNGYFLQSQAKDAVLQMAIHDRIFYRLAQEKGVVLTTDEKEYLENSRTDFWSDLFDVQKERIPGTYTSVNRTLHDIAVAQKYQRRLAEEKKITYASLNWEGEEYEKMKPEHEIRVRRIWKRVVVGDITLVHDLPNYVNGMNPEDFPDR